MSKDKEVKKPTPEEIKAAQATRDHIIKNNQTVRK